MSVRGKVVREMRVERILATFGSALFAAVVLAGCSGDDAVRSRLWVAEINENEALTSDVVASSGTVFEDEVIVLINNDPRPGSNLSPGGPYSFFTIDRYEIEFEAEEEIPPVSGGLGWTVETGTQFEGALTVVPAQHKLEPPLIGLATMAAELQSTANITFYGHEADSDHELVFTTRLQINFANWTD